MGGADKYPISVRYPKVKRIRISDIRKLSGYGYPISENDFGYGYGYGTIRIRKHPLTALRGSHCPRVLSIFERYIFVFQRYMQKAI